MLLALIGLALVVIACREPHDPRRCRDRRDRPGGVHGRAQQRRAEPDPDGVAARGSADRRLRPSPGPARRGADRAGSDLPDRRRVLAARRGRLAVGVGVLLHAPARPAPRADEHRRPPRPAGRGRGAARPRGPPATSASRCRSPAAGSGRPTWPTTRSSTTTSALNAASYRAWLDELAVAYVAVPDTRLDFASVDEAKLIASGLPYLHEVWTTPTGSSTEVNDSAPLARNAQVISVTATSCGSGSTIAAWCRSRSGGPTTSRSSTAPSRCPRACRAHGCLSQDGAVDGAPRAHARAPTC